MDAANLSVFHMHPLQRCNLRCLHCYSSSGPDGREQLSGQLALKAISSAASWGYSELAMAGGEPLLYADLPMLLAHAASVGMGSSVVTNGLLLRSKADIDKLRHAHTVTVSIDGLAMHHDKMRGRRGAHDGAANAVRRLAEAGAHAWVACGVSTHNVNDIEEIVDNAKCWGAQGITFHLVEPTGRACALPLGDFLSSDDRSLLYVTVALLAAAHRDSIDIRIDLLHRETVLQQPALLYAKSEPADRACPAQTVRVLVMYPDGTLVPVCHGIHRRFALGLYNGDPGWLWDHFFERIYPTLCTLGRVALGRLSADETLMLINPGDWLAELSHPKFPSVIGISECSY
jgi:MoaA/NifB/PqqE/SkfB family radical SAM enzyme